MTTARKSHRYFKNFGPSNEKYINDNLLIDMMLKEQTHSTSAAPARAPAAARGRPCG